MSFSHGAFTLGNVLTFAATSLALLLSYVLYLVIVRPLTSPLRNIPGPAPASKWLGNITRIIDEEPGVAHREWSSKYGGVVKYRGMLGEDRVMFTDPTALNHILNARAYDYPKPNEVRGSLARILGRGVLFAEGDDHRRQRRIMNPSFGPGHLRDISPIFIDKSNLLRDKWRQLIASSSVDARTFKNDDELAAYKASKPADETVLDVSRWLSRVTLDVIGTAGFGYEFGAITGEHNDLAEAFQKMISPGGGRKKPTVGTLLAGRYIQMALGWFPFDFAKYVPNERVQSVARGFEVMETETKKIVQDKKRQVAEEGVDSLKNDRKDLMTLLLRSNLGGDSKAVMTDEELQGQMTTMLLAGHETSSTTLTWVLWTLARHPEKQDKLRAEVQEVMQRTGDDLTMEDINGMEYLDAVVREILRLESPVSLTIRTSAKDDMVPLGKPVTGRNGEQLSSVPISAGTPIMIPIVAVNLDKSVWGEDAAEFRPERWTDGKEIGAGVGVYSRMLTFLAGPRACIGYKFAVLEVKSILAVLINEFTFAEREPNMVIERRSAIVTRPLIIGEEALGNRMPLKVALAKKP